MKEIKEGRSPLTTPVRSWFKGKQHRTMIPALLIAVLCGFTSYFYLITSDRINEIYEAETRIAILEVKKLFLKTTVDNLIRDIETERAMTVEHFAGIVDQRYDSYQASPLSSRNFLQTLIADFPPTPNSDQSSLKWTVFIWQADGTVLYDPEGLFQNNVVNTVARIKPRMAHYQIIEHRGLFCLFGFSQQYVDDVVRATATAKIKGLDFGGSSYVWVNEILNYQGGKDYAIRLIHPNLPETEGTFLSTDMTDIKGNLPYLTELDGVKRAGELYFSYYFKERTSDTISEKLTFAKLYSRYDWIISMGVQNTEIEAHIAQTSEKARATAVTKTMELLVVLILLMIGGLTLIILIEGRRHRQSKAQLELELRYDPLTKAKSRRFGVDYLEAAFQTYQADRGARKIAIMLFDIDNFKEINDLYGHSEGDRILQEIVPAVYKVIRSSDELFRWGGDEFVGVFHVANEENTVSLMEKILKATSPITLNLGDGAEAIGISISIGASHFRKEDTEYSDALKRADLAMYASKAAGGNRVSVS